MLARQARLRASTRERERPAIILVRFREFWVGKPTQNHEEARSSNKVTTLQDFVVWRSAKMVFYDGLLS